MDCNTLPLTPTSSMSWPMKAPCVLVNSCRRSTSHMRARSAGGSGIMLGMLHMKANEFIPGGLLLLLMLLLSPAVSDDSAAGRGAPTASAAQVPSPAGVVTRVSATRRCPS